MALLSHLRTLLVLGRVSNLPTVWTNVAVGWFLSGGGWTAELGWLLAGMSFVYIAGMTLNDAFDYALKEAQQTLTITTKKGADLYALKQRPQ